MLCNVFYVIALILAKKEKPNSHSAVGRPRARGRRFIYFSFFRAHRTNDLTKKLEKVGPFECDELEKHCRVSAKCYPTRVPALYTMTKEKFKVKIKWLQICETLNVAHI